MSRYIDADAFDERIRISVGLVEEELTDDYKDGVRCTLEMLKTQPTADVVEVKHGKWIPIKDDDHWYVLRWECSCCGFWTTSDKMANYCEDCGAKMEDGRGE